MPAWLIRIMLLVLVLTGGFGCENPQLTITHWLPGPAGLPIEYTALQSGKCVIEGIEDTDLKDYARTTMTNQLQELIKRYTESVQSEYRPVGHRATVDCVFTIDVQDEKRTRRIEQGNPIKSDQMTSEVDSLIRQVKLHAEFHIHSQRTSGQKVTLEARRHYDSREDPRIRGPLGLRRPDDPKNVPVVNTIVRELIAGSINAFYRMTAPLKIEARMQLKPVLNRQGQRGLKLTKAHKYADAVTSFQAGLDRHPKDKNLRFNLAAAAEAAGQLEKAFDAYQKLAISDPDTNSEIHQAVKRVKRVIAIRKDL